MWISASVALLFIIGLFLSMLSSSPKPDPEWQSDADSTPVTHPTLVNKA